MPAPIAIGIAGGSGSGKTYLARHVQRRAGKAYVARLSMDQYFITPPAEADLDPRDINFDHPIHIDLDGFLDDLLALKRGETVLAPRYDFRERRQLPQAVRIESRPVIVVDGLFLLAWPIVQHFDLTIFLQVDPDQRLIGRLLRDLHERESSIQWNIDRYQRFVRPSYQAFVQPTIQNADLVVDFTYRRVFFQEILAHMVKDYVTDGFDLAGLVASVRGDGWQAGLEGGRTDYQRLVNLEDLLRAPAIPSAPAGSQPAVWAADNPETNGPDTNHTP